MIKFDKPIEEMNDDEKIEAFKSYLHTQIASLISQNLFTSNTTTTTVSTSVIKTTANDTRSIIEGANIDENQNVFTYFFARPNFILFNIRRRESGCQFSNFIIDDILNVDIQLGE